MHDDLIFGNTKIEFKMRRAKSNSKVPTQMFGDLQMRVSARDLRACAMLRVIF